MTYKFKQFFFNLCINNKVFFYYNDEGTTLYFVYVSMLTTSGKKHIQISVFSYNK